MSKEDSNWALQRTHQALDYLLAKPSSEVVWFFMAPPNGWLDRPPNRIDVLIGLRSELAITLQVKSKDEDAERFRENNPYKPVITVKRGDTMMDVARMIEDIIEKCYGYIRHLPKDSQP